MQVLVCLLCVGAIVVTGCSAHNPFIISNTTETTKVAAANYPSHTNKVLVTKESLPPSARFEVLEVVEVGKVWYGSSRNVSQAMANRAREIGADAIIELRTWHQPSGWSWAAPHGSGRAIKMIDPPSIDLSGLKGEWF